MAQRIAGALGHCGVYAVEFFVMSERALSAVIGRTSSMSSKPYVLQAR
jgi:formate-dependent phosphoribosylglycinamide formyltransferase (GAR transformylase)